MRIIRLLSITLVLFTLAASVISCGEKELTADDVFSAVENTVALESSNGKFDIKMSMTQGFGYIDTNVTGTVIKAIVDGEVVTETCMTLDYGIATREERLILIGDTAYTESDGEKMKLPSEYATAGVPILDLSLVKRDCIENVSQNEDGSYSVQIKDGSIDGLIDLFLGMEGIDGNTYSKVSLNFTIEEEYVTECRIGFEMQAIDEEIGDYEATVEGVFTYDSPGSTFTLELPDLSEYKDPVSDE